jgi:ABC-type nitrate/sulfonate/bicarbonate transport system permease component
VTRLRGFLLRWTAFAAVIGVWQVVAVLVAHPFFPSPGEIVAAAGSAWFSGSAADGFLTPQAWDTLLTTIGRVLGGWALAVVAGVGLGIACGLSRTVTTAAGPLFAFFRSLPLPALVPVFVLICTLGTPMVLTVVVFGAVWAVLLNTVDGVRSVDQVKIDTALAYRLPWSQRLVGIVLPAALPKIFAGLRLSLSQALLLTAAAELFAANGGLGEQLRNARDHFEFAEMWAVVMVLGVLGYVFNLILLGVEKKTLGWHRAAGHAYR